MNNNKQSILKEVVVVLLLAAALLGTGAWLIGNVVAAVRSFDTGQVQSGPSIGDFEKALKELIGKILPAEKKSPPPSPSPAPAAPAAPKPESTVKKKAEVTGVKFYEAAKEGAALRERVYNTRFKASSRYIFTEISYKNGNYKVAEADIPIVIQYHGPDGRMVGELKRAARPKIDWPSALYASGWTPDTPGAWQPGQYTVKLSVDGEFVGEYKFVIE